MASSVPARDRLIIALDQDHAEALDLVKRLGDRATFYKVGSATLLKGGLEFLRTLLDMGKRVFLDLKLYDVPNTVTEAVAAAVALGPGLRFATVHGLEPNVQAARKGAGSSDLKVLAVIALTSLTEDDVRRHFNLAADASLQEHMTRGARVMVAAGAHGVIASPNEVAVLRGALPDDALIVTPGVRLPGGDSHDQQRTGTPAGAILAGADHLVMGRPIYQSPDPAATVEQVVADIERALAVRG